MKYSEHQLALGTASFGGEWNNHSYRPDHIKQARIAIETALELGITFIDTADIYNYGKSEKILGEVLKINPNLSKSLVLQSKCGIRFTEDLKQIFYDFSYDHIIRSVEETLDRLHMEQIDILLLHRPNPLIEPEEVSKAFLKLKQDGKVKNFGVSNHTPAQMRLIENYLEMPIIANQIQFSILWTNIMEGGIQNNLQLVNPSGAEGTFEYCKIKDIRVQAWSPLARGVLTGNISDSKDKQLINKINRIKKEISDLAKLYEVSPEAVVIAWVLRHPSKILPILGSTDPKIIKSCAEAVVVKMSSKDWFQLYRLGRGEELP